MTTRKDLSMIDISRVMDPAPGSALAAFLTVGAAVGSIVAPVPTVGLAALIGYPNAAGSLLAPVPKVRTP
jgi:hypothetical protein